MRTTLRRWLAAVVWAGMTGGVLGGEGRPVSVEALSEVVRPPWILNPFRFSGGKDIPFRIAGNRIKVDGRVMELAWGRWSAEVEVRLWEGRNRRVVGLTAFRVDRKGRGVVCRMRPFVLVSTDLATGVAETNGLLVLVRIPQYELRLLRREGEAYRVVASYPVCVGRPKTPTPVASGFVYTKGRVRLRYLFGPQQGEEIRMVRLRPDSPEKGPLDSEKMKGLYLCLGGDGRHMIHATTEWWREREAVSFGCVRLSIPHMAEVYERVPVGTAVRTVYETVEVEGDRLRIWPDVYGREADRTATVIRRLEEAGIRRRKVDQGKVRRLVESGIPVEVPLGAVLREGPGSGEAQASTVDRM